MLLLDGHNSPRLLDMLDSLISDIKQIDSNFRLWVSAKISLPLPCSLLQLTVKVVADSPKVLGQREVFLKYSINGPRSIKIVSIDLDVGLSSNRRGGKSIGPWDHIPRKKFYSQKIFLQKE